MESPEVPKLYVTFDLTSIAAPQAIRLLITLNDLAKSLGIESLVAKPAPFTDDERRKYKEYFDQIKRNERSPAKLTSRECIDELIERYGAPEHHEMIRREFTRIFPEREYGNAPLPAYLVVSFFASSLEYLRMPDVK